MSTVEDNTVANTTRGTIVRDFSRRSSLHPEEPGGGRGKHWSGGRPHTTVGHKRACGEAAGGSELPAPEVLLTVFPLLVQGVTAEPEGPVGEKKTERKVLVLMSSSLSSAT